MTPKIAPMASGATIFSTALPSEVCAFVWNIPDFEAILQMRMHLKQLTLDFKAGSTIGVPTKWGLKLILNAPDGKTRMELRRTGWWPKKCNNPVIAEFSARLQCRDGKNLLEYLLANRINDNYRRIVEFRARYTWTFKAIATGSSSSSLLNFLVDGCLPIQIRLEMFGSHLSNNGMTAEKMKTPRIRNQIQTTLTQSAMTDDLLNLLKSGENSDVIIQTKDLQRFPAHRLILAARSPVFKTMFETVMKESVLGLVQIDDISSKAVGQLLKYLYSASLEEDWITVAEELAYAADKYNLPSLSDFCNKNLMEACTVATSLDLLDLAKRHGLKTAEKDISKFIEDNIGTILETPRVCSRFLSQSSTFNRRSFLGLEKYFKKT